MISSPTKIAVTGGSGFIWTQLVKALLAEGYEVSGLMTRKDVALSPEQLAVRLTGFHAVINLAGAPVMRFFE